MSEGGAEVADAEYRSGPTRFRIVDDALVADSSEGDADRTVALADVAHVRIYVTQGRAFCFISPKTGKPLVITTPQRVKPEDADEYSHFVRAVHERIADVAPEAKFVAGHGAFFALLVVCVVGIVAIFATFVAALVKGADPARVAPLLGTITLPLIVLARSSAGRPRAYDPTDIPEQFLPSSQ